MKTIKTVAEMHEMFSLDSPKHPLITVFKHDDLIQKKDVVNVPIVYDLYQIMYKMCNTGSFQYGRNSYDYQDGTMVFLAPGQVYTMKDWNPEHAVGGWSIIFHPDLIRRSELGQKIDKYQFFSYETNEALHLSDDEKKRMHTSAKDIEKEISQNIDTHSQELIISNIELMLNYSKRFYDRQFYTRTNFNKDIVTKFENILNDYYRSEQQLKNGIPTVKYCAELLNHSANYFSDLLKKETGRSAKDHIHFYIIEKAKTVLLNSENTVSEIAYDLGFEYPQSFGKLFKNKTGITPAEYRIMN